DRGPVFPVYRGLELKCVRGWRDNSDRVSALRELAIPDFIPQPRPDVAIHGSRIVKRLAVTGECVIRVNSALRIVSLDGQFLSFSGGQLEFAVLDKKEAAFHPFAMAGRRVFRVRRLGRSVDSRFGLPLSRKKIEFLELCRSYARHRSFVLHRANGRTRAQRSSNGKAVKLNRGSFYQYIARTGVICSNVSFHSLPCRTQRSETFEHRGQVMLSSTNSSIAASDKVIAVLYETSIES